MVDSTQNFDIELQAIMPEYRSSKRWVSSLFHSRLATALDFVKEIRPHRILDAGCGDGTFIQMLVDLPSVKEVVGVDFNDHTEQINGRIRKASFVRADIRNLPHIGQFDVISCLDVLEHFSDMEPVVLGLRRCLKPGGYFIVSGPTESLWYKLGRLVTKSVYSAKNGPCADMHYHNVYGVQAILSRHFTLQKQVPIRAFGLNAFIVGLYRL